MTTGFLRDMKHVTGTYPSKVTVAGDGKVTVTFTRHQIPPVSAASLQEMPDKVNDAITDYVNANRPKAIQPAPTSVEAAPAASTVPSAGGDANETGPGTVTEGAEANSGTDPGTEKADVETGGETRRRGRRKSE
jgi:hypothetical protein